jgi:chromosome segregation ATPase
LKSADKQAATPELRSASDQRATPHQHRRYDVYDLALERENDELAKENEELTQSNDELAKEKEQLTQMCETASQEKEDMSHQIEDLRIQVEVLTRQKEHLACENSELMQSHRAAIGTVAELTTRMADFERQRANGQPDHTLIARLQALESECQMLKETRDGIQAKLKEEQTKTARLENTVAEMIRERCDVSKMLAERQQDLQSAEGQRDSEIRSPSSSSIRGPW